MINPMEVLATVSALIQAMDEAKEPEEIGAIALSMTVLHRAEQDKFIPKMNRHLKKELEEHPDIAVTLRNEDPARYREVMETPDEDTKGQTPSDGSDLDTFSFSDLVKGKLPS